MKKKNILKEVLDDREDICCLYTRSNDAKHEILNIQRTLKLHGEGHMANDLTPQFRQLCETVKMLEDRMNCGNHPDIITRIRDLELHQSQVNASENIARICERLNALEKAPCCNYQRISDLEATTAGLWEKGTEQDAGILSMLKALPEIEILKVQVAGLENRLSRDQDLISEFDPVGCVTVKKEPKTAQFKSCGNCKHRQIALSKPPCKSCDRNLTKWETKPRDCHGRYCKEAK